MTKPDANLKCAECGLGDAKRRRIDLSEKLDGSEIRVFPLHVECADRVRGRHAESMRELAEAREQETVGNCGYPAP